MNPPRVLIVDDEEAIRFGLVRTLRKEGYQLHAAATGREAIRELQRQPYDLILLDLYMEPVGGMEVFNVARKLDKDITVIILTAHGSLDSSVEALRLGAFDYLFKPASIQSIRDRVHAGLEARRKELKRQNLVTQINSLHQILDELNTNDASARLAVDERFIHAGALIIDTHHQVAAFDDKTLDLTTMGYSILLCLVKNSPKPLTARELVNCGLGYDVKDVEAPKIIKWHIYKLRRKIEPDPTHPQHIKTIRHEGYLWND